MTELKARERQTTEKIFTGEEGQSLRLAEICDGSLKAVMVSRMRHEKRLRYGHGREFQRLGQDLEAVPIQV